MKKLKITVNGTAYDVEVEEQGEFASAPVAAAPVAAPAAPAPVAAAPAPAPAPAKAAVAPADAETTVSPMPGNILDIKVAAGTKVTNGTPILVLEAMKMENDICAPKDGTLVAVLVAKGDVVDSGTPLFSIA